ncbi:MAG: exodeoxyribonuclease VII small subunit [Firmicutes bacterium]|nr:exodeoxyribonuclease VII small subunit [Bacillota bacterium]
MLKNTTNNTASSPANKAGGTKNNSEMQSLETLTSELEQIVAKLSNENIALDEGIKLFEQGIKISEQSLKLLSSKQGKITELTKQLEKLTEVPLVLED